jgi:hypothetical protein
LIRIGVIVKGLAGRVIEVSALLIIEISALLVIEIALLIALAVETILIVLVVIVIHLLLLSQNTVGVSAFIIADFAAFCKDFLQKRPSNTKMGQENA